MNEQTPSAAQTPQEMSHTTQEQIHTPTAGPPGTTTTKERKPTIPRAFYGTTDPGQHIQNFEEWMTGIEMEKKAWHSYFGIPLRGVAKVWYERPPVRDTSCFEKLKEKFMSRFGMEDQEDDTPTRQEQETLPGHTQSQLKPPDSPGPKCRAHTPELLALKLKLEQRRRTIRLSTDPHEKHSAKNNIPTTTAHSAEGDKTIVSAPTPHSENQFGQEREDNLSDTTGEAKRNSDTKTRNKRRAPEE